MVDKHFQKQLQGYTLTTAEIFYHMPDHPGLLQSYIWQEYDVAPRFPHLKKFLDFWSHNLEGTLSQIRIAHQKLITPREFRYVDGVFKLDA